ncbi:MAG: M20/M25/M40 family metallo-hydrolase [Pseudorhodoplanes sp.]
MLRHAALALALAGAMIPGGAAARDGRITAGDRETARAVLDELLAIQSVRGQGKGPDVAAAITARLRAAGFTDADITTISVDGEGEPLTGLFVRYRGRATGQKPVMLLGHIDVVGAVSDNWTVDPFRSTEKDGHVYGRGTLDNKGQVALLVTTFIRLKRAGWTPDRDLILALSGDEESGSRTTQAMLQHPWIKEVEYALNADTGTGEAAQNGKAPRAFISVAEKSSVSFKLEARNAGGHSSMPRTDNALYDIADAIKAIQSLRFPVAFNAVSTAMARDLAGGKGEMAEAFRALLADPGDKEARGIAEKYPEHAYILSTTCVPTMIAGGNARNALPQNAVLTVHCRLLPGASAGDVEEMIRGTIGRSGVTVSIDQARGVGPISPARPDLTAAVTRAVRANYPDAVILPQMFSGGSDARYYRAQGIHTYGVGSLMIDAGDEALKHGIDEHVSLDSFFRELLFWDVLLREIAGGKHRSVRHPSNAE